jgi:tetratricopeptide (TPR) repeat protein
MWKEIVRIALSDETLIPNFLTLYNKLCTDSSIEAQLLAQMKSLIRQQVAVQFQLSKNPLLIEFALEKKKTDEDKKGERPKHEVVFEAAKNDFVKGELAEIANNQTNAVAYWGKSLQGFIAAIQGNPKNNEYYHEFAWAAEKLNSWQIAATVLKKGVDELGETDPILLRFLGRSYAYLQRKDAAIYYLEKAFALDKENAGLAADLITSYYQNEQYKKGIEVASAFLGRKFDIDILYLRGKLYVADGQFGKGSADLKAVMCLNSNYKDAKQSLASAEVQALKTALAGSKAGSVKTEKKKKK